MATEGSSERGELRATTKTNGGTKAFVVERLTHQEVPAATVLYKRVYEAFKPELPSDLLKAWSPTPLEFTSWMEGITFFGVLNDGRVIGSIGCELTHGSCRIVHLVVDPDHRRHGVGRALVTQAVGWAKQHNCPVIWVDALTRFQQAVELFREMGFTESGVLHRYFWNEDVRMFEKVL